MLPNLHRLELIICMTHCEPPCSLLLGRDFLFPLRPMGRLVEGLPKRTQALWMGAPPQPAQWTQSTVSLPGAGLSWGRAGAELAGRLGMHFSTHVLLEVEAADR